MSAERARAMPLGLEDRGLRIAMLAPPWIPVPPLGYGGVEVVVSLLTEELVARGHDVTLFAAPGSHSSAHVRALLSSAHPDTIGSAISESDHVALAFEAVEEAGAGGAPFDVIHDHSGFVALAMASRVNVPMVHTMHGLLVDGSTGFYRRHGHKARLVAISSSQRATAPADVSVAAVVPNPIAVDHWPFEAQKDDYLLWIGRMDPTKGPHRAIEAARLAGRPLVLAGPVQTSAQADYFSERVAPHIDGERVRYVGEVRGDPEKQLYARAAALLMPIRWNEPFGMVMVEALACGTPVIAFAEGAATEIVVDGVNGMIVEDEAAMARAVAHIDEIDPAGCRASVLERYAPAITAAGYEAVYDLAAGPSRVRPRT